MPGELCELLIGSRALNELSESLGRTNATLAVGLAGQAFALAAMAHQASTRPFLIVTATEADAEALSSELGCYLNESATAFPDGELAGPVVHFPAWQTLPFERVSPDVATMGMRVAIRWHLAHPNQHSPRVVVASIKSLLQRLSPLLERHRPLAISRGSACDAAKLVDSLVRMGYRREPQVEHRGEMAVRGGIIDVFPSTALSPIRIDLFGDEVERLTRFDVVDQRSVAEIDHALIYSCRELLIDRGLQERAEEVGESEHWARSHFDRLRDGEDFDGMESWLPWLVSDEVVLTDQLSKDAQVVLIEPRRIRDRGADVVLDEAALADTLALTWGAREQTQEVSFPRLHVDYERVLERCHASVLSLLSVAEGPKTPTLTVRGHVSAGGDPSRLAEMVRGLSKEGYSVTLCVTSLNGTNRICDDLGAEGIGATVVDKASSGPGVEVLCAPLRNGVAIADLKVAIIAESDITGRRSVHRAPRPRARPTDGFFDDLAPGGYVVHRIHGVARYAGMRTMEIAGAARDFLLLEFRGSDRIYLPTDQIANITPYSGGETPTLSKMGGADWQRTRSKVRAAAAEVAEELVALYRRRLEEPGIAFGPDTPWQAEMEAAFPYTETADQLRAIAEVKADMEQPRPMDRLVCGDVGFGKTEVAVRAVFKAVQDGYQAAVLVPTTLLASQHALTFAERYAGFPVKVALLSRFLTTAEANKVVRGLADGSIDVVIATHRMLGADVKFKKLGLLVVDEEQRFGVSHKEAIKELATGIDVLTLSASPIPRTLEMSLTGIRDLSLVNTPPAERRPILTYVGPLDEAAISEAIRRELLREGQVFFLHNRVADIDAVAQNIRELVPEAKVAIAHGQMDEGSLERVVIDFSDRLYNVLVCTTIIESGIDMPSVNTLVVDRADLLGLGQLHQIRGRVGRGGQRAYAYFFHPVDRALSETAYERLRTIGEQSELGAGFKIAMRDLEIRGAGNLLGKDQSGHIAAVGYDLYVSMVADAVAEAKGIVRVAPPSITLDVPTVANLPATYVAAEDARLEAYRRLGEMTKDEEVDDIAAEWIDRFGPLPEPAQGLLAMAHLRVAAISRGITEISMNKPRPGGPRFAIATIAPITLPMSAQVRVRRLFPESSYREESKTLRLALPPNADARTLLEIVCDLVPQENSTSVTTSADSVVSA